MRNLTVSVPDDVYRAARVHAAEHDSSVSALVTRVLFSLLERDDEFARLEARQAAVQQRIRRFRASDRLGREAVHERAVR